MGPLGYPSEPTFLGIFEVPYHVAPIWRHAQIWAPKPLNPMIVGNLLRNEHEGTLFFKSDEKC